MLSNQRNWNGESCFPSPLQMEASKENSRPPLPSVAVEVPPVGWNSWDSPHLILGELQQWRGPLPQHWHGRDGHYRTEPCEFLTSQVSTRNKGALLRYFCCCPQQCKVVVSAWVEKADSFINKWRKETEYRMENNIGSWVWLDQPSLTLSFSPKHLLLCTSHLALLLTAIHWDAAWRQENINSCPPQATEYSA